MDDEESTPEQGGEARVSRSPTETDLILLCRRLNATQARYVVVGGFAVINAGLARTTGDIDLLVEVSPENEARVYRALESLPDAAAREPVPGDLGRYPVIRVADEILVDLLATACGVTYAEVAPDVMLRDLHGVKIPFAPPKWLWQMKIHTNRLKDGPDPVFLKEQYSDEIFGPQGPPDR